jgi:hypothetical protein
MFFLGAAKEKIIVLFFSETVCSNRFAQQTHFKKITVFFNQQK